MQAAVVVDSREGKSQVPAALHRLGVPTEIRRLTVGDYIAGSVVVERKSVRDLHLSIIQKRFWPQIGRLSRATRHPYLLVEGENIDAGPLRPESIRGAILAVSELGIAIIRSDSPADSASWLRLLAARDRRKRRSPRVFASTASTASEAMLAAVPGISVITARALLDRFGSIAAVLEATPDEWLSTRGVGPKRMHALTATLRQEQRTPSQPRSG